VCLTRSGNADCAGLIIYKACLTNASEDTLYSKQTSRNWSCGRLRLHYKDVCKRDVKAAVSIDTASWEHVAFYRMS